MRPRDPRRIFQRRRRARARVNLLPPLSRSEPDGSVTTRQVAEVTLPRAELERMWNAEYLERLARTYWAYLSRVSLGLIRVIYTPEGREIALLGRPLVLLRFHQPEYETQANCGSVSWRINRGLLVAPAGRGKGGLKISADAPEDALEGEGDVTIQVASEVGNFYPLLAGWGWYSRIGRTIYRITQYRIHVLVTNGFLRSLANLELLPSRVGALRAGTRTALAAEAQPTVDERPEPAGTGAGRAA